MEGKQETPRRHRAKSPRLSTSSTCSRTNTTPNPPPPTSPNEALTATPPIPSPTIPRPTQFTHSSPSDVTLRLHFDPPSPSSPKDLELSLHSEVLRRSNYFSALLSDRWQWQVKDSASSSTQALRLNLTVSSSRYDSFDDHLKVLRLLYTSDFHKLINNVSTALSIIHIALELLFEECVSACVRFIEAVAWTDEEEQKVLDLIPLLKEEESRELRARVCVEKEGCTEEMLHDMIIGAMRKDGEKLVVANLLREFSAEEFVRVALRRAYDSRFNQFRDSFREHLNALRGAPTELELELSRVGVAENWEDTMWLVKEMIEVRMADVAVRKWSGENSFAAYLVKALKGNGQFAGSELSHSVLICLNMLTKGVASGSILIDQQVRVGFVRNWLPFLIVFKGKVHQSTEFHASLFPKLERGFLKIISTLPISNSKDFLQKCLAFTTHGPEDCPLLVSTLKTWFRRASHPPQGLVPSCTTTPVPNCDS